MEARQNIERTLLERAAFDGDLKHTQDLLAQNSNSVNERGSDQSTPLMWAARRGHVDVVRELLNAGADPALTNEQRETAADMAATPYTQHHEIVALLEIKRLENYTLKRDLANKTFTGSFFGCSKATKLKWANTAIKLIKEFLVMRENNQIPRGVSVSMYLRDNKNRLNARALKQGELGQIFESILNRDTQNLPSHLKLNH